ncbi:MAG: excinuclease ABC subunit UvrA [Malacoplasma sp.]|nr:excinuclease ABC subunit UvrA [Malacoplasma sp.]
MTDYLLIKGASENNLKNIDVKIPKNKFVVITGVSGSGKSSLAFDTIYAEGQRRYLESLSTYTRQFLGGNEKPKVDSIEGLSPAIAISQKSTSHNPRSTVGTVTEIYDYLRVLFARIGIPYCPNGHGPVEMLTTKQIVDRILDSFNEGDKIQILAPYAQRQKGTFQTDFEKLKKLGFLSLRIDGEIYSLDDEINLNKNNFHTIDVIIDRIIGHKDSDTKTRIHDAVETALKTSEGKKILVLVNDKETLYSETHSCPKCGFTVPEMEPRLFSFNSPLGCCPNCKGLGVTFEPDEDRMVPDASLSINDGGIEFFKNTAGTDNIDWQTFMCLCKHYKIDCNKPIRELSRQQLDYIFYGSDEPIEVKYRSSGGIKQEKMVMYEGVLERVKRLYYSTTSEMARAYYGKFMAEKTCPVCKGKRLGVAALSVKIGGKSIIDVTEMPITECINFFLDLKLDKNRAEIAKMALKEIISRLSFLQNVGLEYLTLSRTAQTLSGGEAQRIRLATQIGSNLTGVLYVLDEPSIGLHQKDNQMLINTLKKMRDLGNTVLVVEHDEDTMMESDFIVDIGPGAGAFGGYLVASGTPKEIIENKKSITGDYLSGRKFIPVPKSRRGGNGQKILIKGCKLNNLKNIDCTIPLGKFICVTGVSGSGKSSLIMDTLVPCINRIMFNPFTSAPKIKSITGISNIDKLIVVSQDPIGRTPRSNPATYVGVWDDIRDLYAQTQEAKARGYKKGRFSFNIVGGRCEKCQGAGLIRVEMQFLPAVYTVCDECNGKRFNDETLAVKYKGKSIYDVLEMSIAEAQTFFFNVPNIHRKLTLLCDVGLGYLKLGANSDDLSGGEAQRIKLAKFLQRNTTKNTILVLDEPTTGLHTDDVKRLIEVLNRIVNNGTTVIVIEHNLEMIKCCDYIIDMGPDGGDNGGKIIATGTPEQITSFSDVSYTAKFLEKVLDKDLKRKK